jgi:hypothetical protein
MNSELEAPLEWTDKAPIQPGWYWWQTNDGDRGIAYYDAHDIGNISTVDGSEWAGAQWAGPIEPPR